MSRVAFRLAAALGMLPAIVHAENVLSSYLKHRFNAEQVQVRELESLQQRISDGKLHLNIRSFIELMLKNSPAVQLARLDVYTAANQITTAKARYDPAMNASFSAQRSVTPFFFGGGFGSGFGGGFGSGGSTSTGGSGTGVIGSTGNN